MMEYLKIVLTALFSLVALFILTKLMGKRQISQLTMFDYIIGMDSYNKRNLLRFFGGDPGKKIYNLMDFTGEARDVDDPWYTGDFEATRRDVVSGTEALFKYLTE